MMYKCEFPGCVYKTIHRSRIHFHHIIPREFGGNNMNHNLISVCPNCHSRIYIPESSTGIHSVCGNDSVIIERWMKSTGGKVLEYIDSGGNLCYQNY